jgi:hypothetical protein
MDAVFGKYKVFPFFVVEFESVTRIHQGTRWPRPNSNALCKDS